MLIGFAYIYVIFFERLASSAPRSEILFNLRQIGLEQAFDLIISGSDDLYAYIDSQGTNKPKPYIYLEASKQLDIFPHRCLVFEDTQAGIEAATGAGMIAVAIPTWITEGQDFSKAKQVIHSMLDFPQMIANCTKTSTAFCISHKLAHSNGE